MSEATPSPFTETTMAGRHQRLAALAAGGPVHRVELFTGVSAWLVTGYAQAKELLTHPDVIKGGPQGPHRDAVPAALSAAMDTHMLSADGVEHSRLRRLVSAAFTGKRIAALEPRVRQITDRLLDDLAEAGAHGAPVDLMTGLGYPLPSAVMSELLGIGDPRLADIQAWSTVVMNGSAFPAETFVTAATEMVDYVRALVAAKRAEPGPDLLSGLVAARDRDDRLSDDELSSTIFLLLAAGHETTVTLICSAAHALLTNPDQLDALRAEPELAGAAIEEVLRWNGPAQVTTPSVTAAPLRIADTTIPAGEIVLPALLAANRDRDQYPEPDRFDIARPPGGHLAFGHGIHHCLGAPLARLEGRVAITALIERFPALRLAVPAQELSWRRGLLVNGLVTLPVDLGLTPNPDDSTRFIPDPDQRVIQARP